MRFAWFSWLVRHFEEFGYSKGPLPGAIGTVAVLVTSVLLWYALHRHKPADVMVAGLTWAVGLGWLAFH